MFQSDINGGEHVSGNGCVSLWVSESVNLFGCFRLFGFLGVVGGGGVLMWWRWPELWGSVLEVVLWMSVRMLI